MSVPAVNSALDVANWFFKQAEREEIYLETEKEKNDKKNFEIYRAQSGQNPLLRTAVDEPSGFSDPVKQLFDSDLEKIFAVKHPGSFFFHQELPDLP